jgi:hypothetical protein
MRWALGENRYPPPPTPPSYRRRLYTTELLRNSSRAGVKIRPIAQVCPMVWADFIPRPPRRGGRGYFSAQNSLIWADFIPRPPSLIRARLRGLRTNPGDPPPPFPRPLKSPLRCRLDQSTILIHATPAGPALEHADTATALRSGRWYFVPYWDVPQAAVAAQRERATGPEGSRAFAHRHCRHTLYDLVMHHNCPWQRISNATANKSLEQNLAIGDGQTKRAPAKPLFSAR